MQSFTIVFSFVVESSAEGLNSSLRIIDENRFVITDENNVVIQPYGTGSIPPMKSISLYDNRFVLNADSNPTRERQAMSLVLPVTATGSSLAVNIPFSGVTVQVSYQFIGHQQTGNLEVGINEIPFPTT